MDNFSDQDIESFIDAYKKHTLDNPLLNQKIPVWVCGKLVCEPRENL